MPRTFSWRAVLICVLCVALARPARAETLQTAVDVVIGGIVAASVAIGVVVTVVILRHRNKKKLITGCVSSGANGMTVTDEKDKRTYALSDAVGLKPGDRMTLEGKLTKTDKTLVFETYRITKDLGVCQP